MPLANAFGDVRPFPQAARTALRQRQGAALLVDAKTKAVLAQCGSDAALNEPHATGSAIKPLTALIALDSGALRPDSEVLCRRDVEAGGVRLRCSHPAVLLPMRVSEALVFSCNYFFADVGRRLRAQALEQGFRRAGMEANVTDAILGATGASGVRTTPRQLLGFTADLAAGRLPFRPEHMALVRQALAAAVREGTAAAAAIDGVAVAGKTGTAAWPGVSYRNSGWFAGWAPADRPRVAVVVWVKNGEGRRAAAIAGQILRDYFSVAQASLPVRTTANSADPTGRNAYPTGTVRVGVMQRGRVTAIRTLDLEQYVAGVLAGEAGEMRQPESLKAMAVAARSFAARNLGRHAKDGFDFCTLTHCQVYTSQALDERFRAAARATAGEVLRFKGRVIQAYYTADCGGHTQAAGNIWPQEAAPYLPARPDPYCVGTGIPARPVWTTRLPARQLEAVLRGDRLADPSGPIGQLAVAERDASGRVRRLRIAGGAERAVDGNYFRFLVDRRLGWDKLKSTAFEVRREGGDFVFEGRGFGHGVGLCQAGTVRMGETGFDYRRILAQYFPGTEVNKLEAGDRRLEARGQETIASAHFNITFPAEHRAEAEEIGKLLEAARSKFAARGITPPPERLSVVFYASTADFIRATGKAGWVAATSDAEGRLRLQPPKLLRERGTLESTLSHEYLHLALWNTTDSRIPAWLREGTVLYFSGENPPPPPPAADARSEPVTLEQALERPRNRDQMRRAYALALEQARLLARQSGDAGLLRLLRQPTETELQRLMAIGGMTL